MSLATSPVTGSENVRVKVIGEALALVPLGVTVTVGASESKATDAVLEVLLGAAAALCAAPALTWQVTAPWPVGVTGMVYVLPLPESVPFVPFVTVIPPSVS